MPRTSRPVDELDDSLGDDLSTALERPIAVSLIVREDGGTDVRLHDRETGVVIPDADVDPAKVDKAVKAHKRRPRPTNPPSSANPPGLALPPALPASAPSFL